MLLVAKAIHGFPPLLMGPCAFLIAGALLMGWCIIREKNIYLEKYQTRSHKRLAAAVVGNGIVIWVEQFLPSAMVAIMVSLPLSGLYCSINPNGKKISTASPYSWA